MTPEIFFSKIAYMQIYHKSIITSFCNTILGAWYVQYDLTIVCKNECTVECLIQLA